MICEKRRLHYIYGKQKNHADTTVIANALHQYYRAATHTGPTIVDGTWMHPSIDETMFKAKPL